MMKRTKDSVDIGVLVSNVNTSLDFYQNLLGLDFVEQVTVRFGKMYRLRFGNSYIKLIEPHIVTPKGRTGLEKQIGFRYLTFSICNLSEVCSKLRDKGVEFAIPEEETRPGVRIAMVKDPDDNIVEFVERK